jgi:predicted CoA-binding protein
LIDEFLSHRKLALVRSSPSTAVMGGQIDKELKPKGYEISVVYLDKSVPAARLADVKDDVEGAIIAVPKAQCEAAVREAVEAGMPRVWLQAGCQTKEALALAEKEGLPVVSGHCVLMYAEPVKSVHAFHRWVAKLFGSYAK